MSYKSSRDSKEYADLIKFNQGLLDGTSELGRIISPESIRASSEKIRAAQIEAMVNAGAAVLLG